MDSRAILEMDIGLLSTGIMLRPLPTCLHELWGKLFMPGLVDLMDPIKPQYDPNIGSLDAEHTSRVLWACQKYRS